MIIPYILFFFWALFMVLSILKGAPFIRTSNKRIEIMLSQVENVSSHRVIDLGSGDGSIVRAFARKGARATGVELNLFLVFWSKLLSLFQGLSPRTTYLWKNMWSVTCTPYDVVCIYGFPSIMADMEKKLISELREGSVIISHAFPFPTLTSIAHIDTIYVYKI